MINNIQNVIKTIKQYKGEKFEFYESEYNLVLQALQEKVEHLENPQLTYEEIKLMHGKPVFIHWGDDFNTKEWGLISISSNDKINIKSTDCQVNDIRMSDCRMYRHELVEK